MKVIQIVTQMEGGGAQRCAIESARLFRQWGTDCHVIFMYRRTGTYDDEPDTISLSPQEPSSIVDYIRIIIRLFFTLKAMAPDAILTHSHYSNIIGCIIGFLLRTPVRVACQTSLAESLPSHTKALDWILGSIGIYQKIIINSKTNFSAFSRLRVPAYRKRMVLVCNGIKEIARRDKDIAFLEYHNVSPNQIVFCAIGRLGELKNYSRLIESIADMGHCSLLIAGDGPLKASLKEQVQQLNAEERIVFLGNLNAEELAQMCGSADVFVHPSLLESFGLAPLEAASAGLPLCVSTLPVLHEILGSQEKANAVFFDPHDVQSIHTALNLIASNQQLRKDLSIKSLTLADHYSLEAMARGYLDTLSSH